MEEKRFDSLNRKVKQGQIQACMISQHDQLIYTYFKNRKAETILHPIHSCTKSIISMLIGICIRDGLIQDLDNPIVDYLPNYTKLFDEEKRTITLKNLLTMTPGFDWPEFGEWNFGSPMEYSKDIVRFVLERDLNTKIGTQMNYNSGCSNLLSYIIQTVSGMKVLDFANRKLFFPLGIKEVVWNEKQGISLGANGLKMKPADMMKLGSLYLHKGKHNNKQIIPAEWVEESTKPRFLTYKNIGSYGYHWWTFSHSTEAGKEVPYYFALGLFGQYIIVVPEYDLVTVFVSENYGESIKPMLYFREHIITEVEREMN